MHGGIVEARNAPGGGLSIEMKLLLPRRVDGNGNV
jgi:hypothetical protein